MRAGSVQPVALGRQAFSLVARHCRDAGASHVILPEYCCQTMVTPWQLEGMAVSRVRCGADLLMDAQHLAETVERLHSDARRPVIVHCRTYGNVESPQLHKVLTEAGRNGAGLVIDTTHSFLDDPPDRLRAVQRAACHLGGLGESGVTGPCDENRAGRAGEHGGVTPDRNPAPRGHGSPLQEESAGPQPEALAGSLRCLEVASTRKLLPVTEFTWVAGVSLGPDHTGTHLDGIGPRTQLDEDFTAARQRFLTDPGVDTFECAEDLADEAWQPVRPARRASRAFATFDLAGCARRIRRTRQRVLDALPAVEVVNPAATCPLIVRTQRADVLADALHDHGIVGPLHWDRPEHLPAGTRWPTDLLCLPAIMTDAQIEVVARHVRNCNRG